MTLTYNILLNHASPQLSLPIILFIATIQSMLNLDDYILTQWLACFINEKEIREKNFLKECQVTPQKLVKE